MSVRAVLFSVGAIVLLSVREVTLTVRIVSSFAKRPSSSDETTTAAAATQIPLASAVFACVSRLLACLLLGLFRATCSSRSLLFHD